jgi:Na+-transporting methylmalonyl-CoA/oxaloacetate decarboxylase gamma subunit
MNWRLSLRGTVNKGSLGILLSLLFILVCIIVWMGKSASQASEEVSFSNEAQAQHAENVATSAARQDPEVAAAIAKAEETGLPEDIAYAEALLAEMVGVLTQDIAEMRGSGMGWGEIAHYFGVHPGVLGLGHSKPGAHYGLQTSQPGRGRSEIAQATVRDFRGDQGHHLSGVASGSKGLGLAHAKGHSKNSGQGHGLGHAYGHAAGHGHGHGGGHGGGKK